ncbi:MAG TPA: AEC family transporter [Rhizobiaceae bacterium]|nr:AEC family transporter [Rhizobiaceae bacterium]
MSPLAETIGFVFGLVAFGYMAGWSGLLKAQTGDALTDFAVTIALPLLLFRTMAGADFHDGVPWSLWGAYFSSGAIAWLAAQFSVIYIFGRDERAGVVAGVTAAFSNQLLLGVPLIFGAFGQSGFEVLSLILSIHLPIMTAATIVLLALVGGKREAGGVDFVGLLRQFLSTMLNNPLIIGILAGLFWRLTGFEMPALAERLVDSLANLAGPLALFAVGLGLRKFGLSGNLSPAILLVGIKLALMPAVALAMAMLFGLPPLAAKVTVAVASLPSGVNTYLIATRFGTGQALASNAMTIGTACAFLTTGTWLAIAQWVFG